MQRKNDSLLSCGQVHEKVEKDKAGYYRITSQLLRSTLALWEKISAELSASFLGQLFALWSE